MAAPDLKVGCLVEFRLKVNGILDWQRGIVRFLGSTGFATGIWAGIELSHPVGKNNGTVNQVKYFTCPPDHGVFVKHNLVTVVHEPVESPPAPTPPLPHTVSVTSPLLNRTRPVIPREPAEPQPTSTSLLHRQALAASPPPNRIRPPISRVVAPDAGESFGSQLSSTPPLPSPVALSPPPNRIRPAVPHESIESRPTSTAPLPRPLTVPSPPPNRAQPGPGNEQTSNAGPNRQSSLRSPPSSSPSRSASPPKPASGSILSPGPAISRVPSAPSKRTSTLRIPPVGIQPPRKVFNRLGPGPDALGPSSSSSPTLDSPVAREPAKVLSPQPVTRLPSPQPAPRTSPLAFTSPLTTTQRALPSLDPPSPKTPFRAQDHKTQDDQELQELRAKIRVLETKRADDARHIRELESRLTEAESFIVLRPKLQAKLNTQQTELSATRRELADVQQLSQLADTRLADAQEQLEMAMLDKEVAEEKAELVEAELNDLREKLAVADVELSVLKKMGAGAQSEDPSPDSKASLSHIQLEKQNERLKEALIRLRDMSQESELEQRRRIIELEKETVGLDDLHSQYESALIKLSNAEVQVENLKLQLDDALGAEEMLVQLTERNLMLSEKIEEMRITIEDLEALKELNDELEENHIETEKAMQEDLDLKDTQIREQVRKNELLEENCIDLESTINQFRELVLQLQSECDALRAQTQSAQNESVTAASQTAAMVSLNLRLQSSASKNQAKNIELELRKLEARETRELLGILQPYLPQVYVESDSDATSCYLFFLRLAFKADLINTVVAQAHNLPEALNGRVSDVLIGICEMRGRISSLSTLCKRFAAILRRCDVESFLNIGRIFQEVAPMERRVDIHIDLLRRDEFREMECVSDIVKIQAQCDHLAETYFNGFDHDLGECQLGYALSFDHDLDVFGSCIALTKTAIVETLNDDEVTTEMGGLDPETELFEPLQQLLNQFKSAKVLSRKLARRLEDLVNDSAALKSHLLPQLKALSNLVPELVNFGISLAQRIMPYLSDARNSKSSFALGSVLSFVNETVASTVGKDVARGTPPWDAVRQSIAHIIQEAHKLLPLALEQENVAKITGVSPWVTRIAEIKSALAVNVEAERKVAQLNDEMQAFARSLKAKDQTVQESGVKIELMERRMEAMKKQAEAIVGLENELAKAKKQERAYEEAIEQLQADLDTLEQDNAKLKSMSSGPERQSSSQQEPESAPVESNIETSHLLEQIEALRGAVRFLRTENSFLRGHDLLREIQALPPLPEFHARSPTPPLDNSTQTDTDNSDLETDYAETRPTIRSLAAETKLLYRDVIKFSSSPRVVDLSASRADAKGGRVWMPKKRTPGYHVLERKMEAERLSRRVRGLLDRTNVLQ